MTIEFQNARLYNVAELRPDGDGWLMQRVPEGVRCHLNFGNSAGVAEVGWAAQMSATLGRPVPLPLSRDEARAFFAERETMPV